MMKKVYDDRKAKRVRVGGSRMQVENDRRSLRSFIAEQNLIDK